MLAADKIILDGVAAVCRSRRRWWQCDDDDDDLNLNLTMLLLGKEHANGRAIARMPTTIRKNIVLPLLDIIEH